MPTNKGNLNGKAFEQRVENALRLGMAPGAILKKQVLIGKTFTGRRRRVDFAVYQNEQLQYFAEAKHLSSGPKTSGSAASEKLPALLLNINLGEVPTVVYLKKTKSWLDADRWLSEQVGQPGNEKLDSVRFLD